MLGITRRPHIYLIELNLCILSFHSLVHFTFHQGNDGDGYYVKSRCRSVKRFHFFSPFFVFSCVQTYTGFRLWRQVCRRETFRWRYGCWLLSVETQYLLVTITSNKIPNCLSAIITIKLNWLFRYTKTVFLFSTFYESYFARKRIFLFVCVTSCFLFVLTISISRPEKQRNGKIYVTYQGQRKELSAVGENFLRIKLMHTFVWHQILLRDVISRNHNSWTNKNEKCQTKEFLYENFAFTERCGGVVLSCHMLFLRS